MFDKKRKKVYNKIVNTKTSGQGEIPDRWYSPRAQIWLFCKHELVGFQYR